MWRLEPIDYMFEKLACPCFLKHQSSKTKRRNIMAQSVYESDVRREFPSLAVFSIWFGTLLIGFTAVTHLAIGERNQAWVEPFSTGLRFTLLALLLASIGFLAFNSQSGLKLAALPLFINMGTVMIILFVPFDALWEELNFRWQTPNYQAAAKLVETGAVVPDVTGVAYLPSQYQHLSADNGRIQIIQRAEATEILFIQERQGSSFTGYIYVSDNSPPRTDDFNGRWRSVLQKQPSWFYVMSDS
jgi:hypothetical protein